MDELFAELLRLDTDCEKAFAKVQLKKQFATVTLDFKDAEDGRTDYDIIVMDNIQGTSRAPIPRQNAGAEIMAVQKHSRSCSGARIPVPRSAPERKLLLGTIPIGELIAKAGFDWSKKGGKVASAKDDETQGGELKAGRAKQEQAETRAKGMRV